MAIDYLYSSMRDLRAVALSPLALHKRNLGDEREAHEATWSGTTLLEHAGRKVQGPRVKVLASPDALSSDLDAGVSLR